MGRGVFELIKAIASRASTEGYPINLFNQSPEPHSHIRLSVEYSPDTPSGPRTLLSYVWPGEPPEEVGLFTILLSSESLLTRINALAVILALSILDFLFRCFCWILSREQPRQLIHVVDEYSAGVEPDRSTGNWKLSRYQDQVVGLAVIDGLGKTTSPITPPGALPKKVFKRTSMNSSSLPSYLNLTSFKLRCVRSVTILLTLCSH